MKIGFLKAIDKIIGRVAALVFPRSAHSHGGIGKKFLFIRPGGIGDAVLLIPSIRALHGHVSDVSIDILCERRNIGAFDLCPGINKVFIYDRWPDLLHLFRERYDVIIDTEQWHRLSAVVARMIPSQRRIGYGTNERRRLLTDALPYDHHSPEDITFLRLISPVGIQDVKIRYFLSIPIPAERSAYHILKTLEENNLIVLFPGASISERRWGREKFSSLACGLASYGLKTIVVGGGGDTTDGDFIATRSKGMSLAGKTSLAETAAVLKKCKLLVSGDSGILHLAVGLGVPTVSLFGPGIQAKWGPKGDNHIVINKNLSCSPCTKFGYTPKCPYDARCMKEITVDEVEVAVLELLSRKKENKSVDTGEVAQV